MSFIKFDNGVTISTLHIVRPDAEGVVHMNDATITVDNGETVRTYTGDVKVSMQDGIVDMGWHRWDFGPTGRPLRKSNRELMLEGIRGGRNPYKPRTRDHRLFEYGRNTKQKRDLTRAPKSRRGAR
jgi:hypothetical protein